jgi:hypothetical protein
MKYQLHEDVVICLKNLAQPIEGRIIECTSWVDWGNVYRVKLKDGSVGWFRESCLQAPSAGR